MTERRRRILALLWTIDDLLPAPHGALNPARGLAAAERRACPDCGNTDHEGWRVERERGFTRIAGACTTCGGKPEPSGKHGQWLQRDAGRGWIQVDPMDSEHAPVQSVDVAARPTRPPRMVSCDGCHGDPGSGVGPVHLLDPGDPAKGEYRDPCPHCGGSGKRPVTPFTLDVDEERDGSTAFEAALIKRREAGSYHELEQALAALPERWLRLIRALYVTRAKRPEHLSGEETVILEASTVAIEFLMPDRVQVPPQVWRAWKAAELGQPTRALGRGAGRQLLERRDKEIRRLDREGKPRQWIARQYGVSVATVKAIVSGARVA